MVKNKFLSKLLERCMTYDPRDLGFLEVVNRGVEHFRIFLEPKILEYLGHYNWSLWIQRDFYWKVSENENGEWLDKKHYLRYKITYYNPENKKLPFEYDIITWSDGTVTVELDKDNKMTKDNKFVYELVLNFVKRFITERITVK